MKNCGKKFLIVHKKTIVFCKRVYNENVIRIMVFEKNVKNLRNYT